MEPSDAKRLRALKDENGKQLAEQMLDNATLRGINSKNGDGRRERAGRWRCSDAPREKDTVETVANGAKPVGGETPKRQKNSAVAIDITKVCFVFG